MFCMICGKEEETLDVPTLEQLASLVVNNRRTTTARSLIVNEDTPESVVEGEIQEKIDNTPFKETDFKIAGYVLQVCSDTCWNDFQSMPFLGRENIERDLKVNGNAGLGQSEKLVWSQTGLHCSSCGRIIGNTCEGHR